MINQSDKPIFYSQQNLENMSKRVISVFKLRETLQHINVKQRIFIYQMSVGESSFLCSDLKKDTACALTVSCRKMQMYENLYLIFCMDVQMCQLFMPSYQRCRLSHCAVLLLLILSNPEDGVRWECVTST